MEALNLGKVRGTAIYTGGTITGTVVAGTIFSNSGITKAYQDDIYINTDAGSESRGNVYVCLVGGAPEDAEWSYEGNIRGPQVELVNNLDSLLTTKALSAYQGKVLRELILNAGAYAKEIPVYIEETVYSVKLVVENADTTITLTLGENIVSKSYVKTGDSAERTLTIAAGENSGTLKRIESSGAYIKSYVLYDSESKEIYSETLDIWDRIDTILQGIEPYGSIVDGAETIKTGLLSKFFGSVKKTLYPITHAKAAWFDKANNKTVYDAITEAKTAAENARNYEGTLATFPESGSTGILYVDTETGMLYRWEPKSGSYISVGGGSSDNIDVYQKENVLYISRHPTGESTYSGSYTITPKVTAQTMETAGKNMADDVTIDQIPRYDVSNASGITVAIGDDENYGS